MKLTRLLMIPAVAVCLSVAATAQDFDSWGDDDFGGDDDFISFDDGDSFSFGDDDFGSFDSFGSDDSSSSLPITFSGDLSLDSRYYFAKDDSDAFLAGTRDTTSVKLGHHDSAGKKAKVKNGKLSAMPKVKLGIDYSGSMSDMNLTLNFTKQTLEDYHEDIIDELTIRGYFLDRRLILEGGKMKIVWGKGDKLHVLDNFNADDYTDFIIPDYIDRRISTPMLRAVYTTDTASPISIEAVFTPFLPKDRFAKEGMWVPGSYATLKSSITGGFETLIAAYSLLAPAAVPAIMARASSFDEDDLYPDTNTLKYIQAGLHVTGTMGVVDWGASYYYGRYKQPSVDAAKLATSLKNYVTGASSDIEGLDYDRKQTFGIEAATIVGRFNLRAEAGYTITDDMKGDDPAVHNNSLGWVAGFDIDLPINNMNLNVQETGTYILANNKIKPGDIEYDAKDRYTNDKLVVNITDSWMNDKLKPELTLLWGIERGDVVVQPKVSYNPTPELTLSVSGMMIYCRDRYSEFSYWKNNNFVNLGIRYQF